MFASLNNSYEMTNNKTDEFTLQEQQLALVGKILAHPARIAIINLLAEKKEIKTGDISGYLPISRTTTSQHLRFLKNAGVIKGTIDGLKIHYCLDMEVMADLKNIVNTFFNGAISNFMCEC
jgi:ArsR family transcriptional regulator, arsenate/arsenite/antimonite-responsive transcriptional repressor